MSNKRKFEKKKFEKSKNNDFLFHQYFTETEKNYSGIGLKIIYYIQTLPPDVKKLKKLLGRTNSNY